MRNCPSCQRLCKQDAWFCPQCGASLTGTPPLKRTSLPLILSIGAWFVLLFIAAMFIRAIRFP